MSAADFLAIVGGKGDYGSRGANIEDDDTVGESEGAIVAFAVKDNEGRRHWLQHANDASG